MTSRDVYPTPPTPSTSSHPLGVFVLLLLLWLWCNPPCKLAHTLCIRHVVCGKATWNIYVLVDFSPSHSLSLSLFLWVCVLIFYDAQATKMKIVMLNLHKIPREFILMSPNESITYKRVETREYDGIRYTYIYFFQCARWQATTCRRYLCQQIMHLPEEEDKDDDDDDVSSCEQDSSGTRDSLNALHHVESPTQSVISMNCRPIADWVPLKTNTNTHIHSHVELLLCAINVTIDWRQNFHNLTSISCAIHSPSPPPPSCR